MLKSVSLGLGVLAVMAAACQAKAANLPMPERVFGSNSFWAIPIPANAPLHTNSANFAADFVRQKKAYYGTVTINTKAYACPVYVVGSEVPPVPVKEWNCQKKTYTDANLARQWAAVPIPAFAEQADGTDAEMAIYQPSSDTLWEFWQARKNNGQWEACWGGSLTNVSGSDGIFPRHYGTTATSLPFVGGQITPEELQRGEIRHVMGIALVDTETWSVFSWPANRSDGYNPQHAPNRIPEGLRCRLDPAVNVEGLSLHPVGKIIARAAQKYGFVVWDKAGAISLRAQNPKAYTLQGQPDPYPALFGKTPAYAILSGFPWERLQFMPHDYGRLKD